jgi:serine/threonine-protein kinase RsbW
MHPHHKDRHAGTRTVDLGLEEHAEQVQAHARAELQPLFEHIEAWMRVLAYPSRDIFAVTLALNEAVVNAFRHGNRDDPSKSVVVRYLVRPDEVLLEVEDQGQGFDPSAVPDPLTEEGLNRPAGRGLFMMRAYMTWVSFNREGNRVTLCRQRSLS